MYEGDDDDVSGEMCVCVCLRVCPCVGGLERAFSCGDDATGSQGLCERDTRSKPVSQERERGRRTDRGMGR